MSTQRIFTMPFAKVYPLYLSKAEKKNRSAEEVDAPILWLTGYDQAGLNHQLQANVDCQTFFDQAPAFNPRASLITGSICGVRVEDVADPTMQRIRYLDKLIDELAHGKTLDQIYR
ncbi:hypothetical protein IV54_GL001290 [Levilactobacillus paucivorans]|uniref:DUF2200 domain-containing protein n=1 Tax=Levilactobacillus paucivorans TaxID=616990 RepID=A0A0R2LTE1_9LACO|nr:DUF2200 domain-containing protein [Levilactobacillus paucivorans]KRO04503.1 hypothetical protein IV54_GL001290 [Levilactobacillus paucivorans]